MGQKVGGSYFVPIETMCFRLFAILSPHDGEMGILYPEKRLLYLFGAKSAQNGPFWAVFREFLRREGFVPIETICF